MKQTLVDIKTDRSGCLGLLPETLDDIWALYNVIHPGDTVEGLTWRRIVPEGVKSKGERKQIHLSIRVLKTECDLEIGAVSVKGQVVRENPHVRIGAHHTLMIEINKPIKIYKDLWESLTLRRIREMANGDSSANVAAVVFELGIGHVCLITNTNVYLKQKVELSIPKKNGCSYTRTNKVSRFYSELASAMRTHLDLAKIQVILVASPGNYQTDFHHQIFAKALLDSSWKPKIVLGKSSNGFLGSLEEALKRSKVTEKLAKTLYLQEMAILDSFFSTMKMCPTRTYYGYDHVEAANQQGAIKDLLISELLFRSVQVDERAKYHRLVDSVSSKGGKVVLFCGNSPSCERLNQMSGIAAILSFGIPEEDICPDMV